MVKDLNPASFTSLLSLMDHLGVRSGHPDDTYVTMATTRKGVFKSRDGSAVATLDDCASVALNGDLFTQDYSDSCM